MSAGTFSQLTAIAGSVTSGRMPISPVPNRQPSSIPDAVPRSGRPCSAIRGSKFLLVALAIASFSLAHQQYSGGLMAAPKQGFQPYVLLEIEETYNQGGPVDQKIIVINERTGKVIRTEHPLRPGRVISSLYVKRFHCFVVMEYGYDGGLEGLTNTVPPQQSASRRQIKPLPRANLSALLESLEKAAEAMKGNLTTVKKNPETVLKAIHDAQALAKPFFGQHGARVQGEPLEDVRRTILKGRTNIATEYTKPYAKHLHTYASEFVEMPDERLFAALEPSRKPSGDLFAVRSLVTDFHASLKAAIQPGTLWAFPCGDSLLMPTTLQLVRSGQVLQEVPVPALESQDGGGPPKGFKPDPLTPRRPSPF